MDSRTRSPQSDPLVVTGCGSVAIGEIGDCPLEITRLIEAQVDVTPWLLSQKMRKFMGKQDLLAVVAAGRALDAAALAPERRAQLGLHTVSGYIPFERAAIEPIGDNATVDGAFSMAAFAEIALRRINPLLTFRCLPNMPAFHVSLNFGISGPYVTSYPGAGQLYLGLEEAQTQLVSGEIGGVLLGAAADQRNFLVQHQLARISLPQAELLDCGAFLLLETASQARARGAAVLAELVALELTYTAPDVLLQAPAHAESFSHGSQPLAWGAAGHAGAASLPLYLDWAVRLGLRGELRHQLQTTDGIRAASRWRVG